jgi:hypothetical protein
MGIESIIPDNEADFERHLHGDTMNNITHLNRVRSERSGATAITASKANLIIAGHAASCSVQLDLIALYLIETGRHELAEAVRVAAKAVSNAAKLIGGA